MKKTPLSLNKFGWAGLSKIALDRFRVYVAYVQLYMILKLYLKQEGWEWWYLLLVPVGIVAIFFDIVYVYRGEQQAAFDVHPYMPNIRDSISKIEKCLEDLNRKFNEAHCDNAKL